MRYSLPRFDSTRGLGVARDNHLRLVEVKGVSGTREQVLLAANEVRRADENQEWGLAILTQA